MSKRVFAFPAPHVAALLTLSVALSACTLAQNPPANGLIVADHLNAPQGVTLTADGSLWIADSGTGGSGSYTTPAGPGGGAPTQVSYGDSASVIRISPAGQRRTMATLPSEVEPDGTSGASRMAELGGQLYVTSGHWTSGASIAQPPHVAAVVKLEGGAVTDLANLWAYELANNPDQQNVDAHPYALAAGPDGKLWVADAGGNDLLRVDLATGSITQVAVFSPLPNANPGPGVPPFSEAVPTGIAFLKGDAYVSLLPGYPFAPGASKVVRVAPDGRTTDYATGLSTTTDLRSGPDGNLYAVELGTFGQEGPLPGTGSIVRIKAGGIKETVLSGLNTPTSLAFNAKGDAFVTVNGAAAPGSGQVRRWDRLTARAAVK